MLLRQVLRPFLQKNSSINSAVCRFATNAPEQGSRMLNRVVQLQEYDAGVRKWMLISLTVVPGMVGVALALNYLEPEDHTPPEFREYEHIRIRTKAYKWRNGDQTLIHNPYTNATTEGYEKVYVHH